MSKFCKMQKLRLGQLLVLLNAGEDVFYLEDKELERRFNILWLKEKPIKVHGGYYPIGHKKEKNEKHKKALLPLTGLKDK